MPLTLAAACLALYAPGLGATALWSKDETTYAEIVREMLRSGDWMTLHLNGTPWFNHPPLFYWMMALSCRLVGSVEIACRLPALLFGVGGVVLVYAWGRSLFGARSGLLAAACLALNLQYWLESRMAVLDTTFLFFLSLSLLCFWHGWRHESRAAWYGAFAAAGLACLSKGPYGLLFPLFIAAPTILLSGRRGRDVPWIGGLLLTLLVGGWWYVAETVRYGRAFSDPVFVYYFLGRMSTAVEDQAGPLWLYLPILLLGFMPWSLYLPQALRWLWRERSREEALLTLLWLAIPFAVITAAATKLPSYALLCYPAAAVAVGAFLDGALDELRQRWAAPLIGAILAGILVFATASQVPSRYALFAPAMHAFAVAALPLALGGLLATRAGARLTLRVAPPAIAMAVLLVSLEIWIAPRVEAARAVKPLGTLAGRLAGPADRLATLGEGLHGIAYYADRDVLQLDSAAEAESLLRARRGAFVILHRDDLDAVRQAPGIRYWELASQADAVLVSNRAPREAAATLSGAGALPAVR